MTRDRLVQRAIPVVTGVVLGVALVLVTSQQAADAGSKSIDAVALGLCLITGLSLAFRRSHPLEQFLVAISATIAYTAREYPGGPIYVTFFAGTLAMVVDTATRVWLPAVRDRRPDARPRAPPDGRAAGGTRSARSSRLGLRLGRHSARPSACAARQLLEAEQRAASAERTRAEEARRQVAEERLRIARDVHDIVGHSLATITLQAGVAEHLLEERPEQARAAVAAIRRVGKESMAELQGAARAAARGRRRAARADPDLEALPRLVEDMRAAGLAVELERDGDTAPVPELIAVAAFRIAQEALTNVARHAGPGARAVVRLARRPAELRAGDRRRRDRRAGRDARRQRADRDARARRRAGGRLEAGPRTGGGYRVLAILPRAVIRVALVDDQALIRGGLRALLDAEPGFEVVGEAADGEAALVLIRAQRPDVVLMDIRMPILDGLEATRRIAADEALAHVRVVVLTTFELDEYVFAALRAGRERLPAQGRGPGRAPARAARRRDR